MVKSILIKAEIEGSGIVNFDSNDQKYLWNKQKDVERCSFDNVSFGKGRYSKYTDNDKEYYKKVSVISADCIRHTMYEDTMAVHLPNIMHNDEHLISAVATPTLLERGYMFARKDKTTWKRKSPFTLSYAKCVTNGVNALETFANSQQKTATEDAAGTSFFKREVAGEMKYELIGAIDLSELGFISMSEVHDRVAFDDDYAGKFVTKLTAKLGSQVDEAGYFKKSADIYDIPERGIKLTKEQVKFLATDILRRLARFSLARTVTGNAHTTKVSIKFVNDPLEDRFTSDDGWVEIFDGKKFNAELIVADDIEIGYEKVELVNEAKEKVKNYKDKFGFKEEKKEKKVK